MDGTSFVRWWWPRLSLVVLLMLFAAASPRSLAGQQSAARVDSAAVDVATLSLRLAEQERRMAALEAEVKEVRRILTILAPPLAPPRIRSEPTAPPATARSAWHVPSNWDRIQTGMSQSQVLSILGSPTSREDTYGLITLFYRGEVSGSGFVSGNVKLNEDRVYLVNKPVF